jgi:hypothetical protein
MTAEYVFSFLAKNRTISVDTHCLSTGTARGLDEAITEGEGNSCFVTDDTRRRIIVTRNIVPGEHLLIRYAYEYWMDSKWPLDQLTKMYDKSRHTKPEGSTSSKI